MVANAAKLSLETNGSSLVVDDISSYFYKSLNELYGMNQQEVGVYQLRSARRRFEQMVPTVAALKDQADQAGVTRIGGLNDLVPLLFNHTAYKSYPLSLLENNRFDLLTKWLSRLTPIDLSGIDASKCGSVDEWMEVLEAKTPLQVYHTTGTSGKLSFIPRTTLERDFFNQSFLKEFTDGFGAKPDIKIGGADGERLPTVYPSWRHGRYATQRVIKFISEEISPSPDECYTISNGTLSADLVSLSGRIRVAQAKGELAKMKISDAQRTALKRYLEEQARRPQEMTDFFARIAEQLQGKRVMLIGPANYLLQAAQTAKQRGLVNAFASNSLMQTGGGNKDSVLPPDWREQIQAFTGIPKYVLAYGMTELNFLNSACEEEENMHLPPYVLPFLLDPEAGIRCRAQARRPANSPFST